MNLMLRLDKAITMLEVAEDAHNENAVTGSELAAVVVEALATFRSVQNELVEIVEEISLMKRKLEGRR